MPAGFGPFWAFFGLFTGVGKLVMIASIALLLFGKGDVVRHFTPAPLRPFLPSRDPSRGPGSAPAVLRP